MAHYNGDSLVYFSTEQGFSGNQITGISEDPKGNLWFSTDLGVVKYDWSKSEKGEKVFTNLTIPSVFMTKGTWSIYADSKGIIWIGTRAGVLRYDGQDFAPFPLPYSEEEQNASSFTNKTIWSTMEDKKGNIWFGTNGNGAFKYDGRTFTQFTEKDGLTDNRVDVILEDSKGNYWFGTRDGGISFLMEKNLRIILRKIVLGTMKFV